MCGIAGLFPTTTGREQAAATVTRMRDLLQHRGPDSAGLWQCDDTALTLGHRRLSIQDLSESGAQPMHSAGGRYSIVFNGEIYNFRDISDELSARGYRFRGHSDTEVMLAAFEEYGLEAALPRFTGMFAFALWDREQRTLTLCRDRMGEKPLYYALANGELYFASELRSLTHALPAAALDTDLDGLASLLKHGYIAAPRSIYKGVKKLLPGHSLTIRQQHLAAGECPQSQAYWRVIDAARAGLAEPIRDEQEALDRSRELLHGIVRNQLIADVPVGTFLSGGIDSTLVSAIAQQEFSGNINTYTIGFSVKEYDESAYAERIAQHLGSHHTTLQITPADVLDVVPQLPSIYDEPFADSSQIPTYLVSKLARQHVTVCLSGDGGDELFAGYNRYLWTRALWGKLSKLPGPARQLLGAMLRAPSPATWDRLYSMIPGRDSYQRQKLVGLKLQKLGGLLRYDDIHEAYDFLMSYWNEPAQIINGIDRSVTGTATRELQGADFIDQAMYSDQVHYLPGDNLTKTDRASMAVSLETRLPLLSHDFVELSWRIPQSMKVRGNTSKHLLRQLLYESVPREMIDRPKMGFSVPVAHWLRDELKEWAQDLLHSDAATTSGMFDRARIERTWQQHVDGSHDHSARLWSLLMYLAWKQAC